MDAQSICRVASLIGEPGRMKMLHAMLDGNSHSASALAIAADVSAQTASSHLAKLLAGGMVAFEQQGRQRLFRLKNEDVAAAIEALGALAHDPESSAVPEIRFARTCYDHLAGVLAIAVRDELFKREALRHKKGAFSVTPAGEKFFRALDIDTDSLRRLRRSFAHTCLDWTERRHHIGGAVGAALLTHFLNMNWLTRVRGIRSVRLTHLGERGFEKVFGIRCATLRAQAGVYSNANGARR
jgi:DNA-binding transcriptional ArsR family regulator